MLVLKFLQRLLLIGLRQWQTELLDIHNQLSYQEGTFWRGVVILHETIHEIRRKKQSGLILKLDFENVYWSFLQQALRMNGFMSQWCKWIESIVSGGNVGIKINDKMENIFQTKKGLRQGDPLSSVLFNLVTDMLAVFISRAGIVEQLKGLVPHLVDGGLSIL